MWSYHSTVKKRITESGFGIVSAEIYKTHLRANLVQTPVRSKTPQVAAQVHSTHLET
jgi:hypothetical protein